MFEDLCARFPLGPGWSAVERFAETVPLGREALALSGVWASGPSGERLTGSAASREPSPPFLPRSYFELLERVSVVDAIRRRAPAYELRDRSGSLRGLAPAALVFPESPSPERCRPSRSNGVAIHTTWAEACDRALAELVERDRVLRSWYGESTPVHLGTPRALVPEDLHRRADWIACELPAAPWAVEAPLSVVLVAGLPKRIEVPFAFGAAAAPDIDQAARAAAEEAVQRLGFLLGEEIPDAVPEFAPTPDFHQEFFLYPPSLRLFRDWIAGGATSNETGGESLRASPAKAVFVDLTPEHLRGALHVAKAVCPAAEPLWFGEPAPHRTGVAADRRVHPVA